MKRFFREPLAHFVFLGILLFGLDGFLRERAGEAAGGEIVVSEGRIENLAALFAKTRQRPPTAEELRGLVNDYVLEEALYREGVALGVDQDDTVIRRRVRQKMEFFVDGGDALRTDAERMLAELRSTDGTSDPRELADGSLLEPGYADVGADMVASRFGQTFADQLAELPTGQWSGPVESAFGVHLVFVDAKTAGRLPTLAEARDAVARDWSFAQREDASKAFHEKIVARYRVTIEWPQDRLALRGAEPGEVQP
jgi:hypothetical protein